MTAKGFKTRIKRRGENKYIYELYLQGAILAGKDELFFGSYESTEDAQGIAIAMLDSIRSAKEVQKIKDSEPLFTSKNLHSDRVREGLEDCPHLEVIGGKWIGDIWRSDCKECDRIEPFNSGVPDVDFCAKHLPVNCWDCWVGFVTSGMSDPNLADYLTDEFLQIRQWLKATSDERYLLGMHKPRKNRPFKRVGSWQQEQRITREIDKGKKLWDSPVRTYDASSHKKRLLLQFERGRSMMDTTRQWVAIVK